MPARAGLLVLALAVGLVHLAAQGPPPPGPSPPAAQRPDQRPPITFRSEVNFVEIDAIVTDRDGRFVPDLKQEDFELVEEGKRQTITTFSLVNIPVDRSLSTGLARQAVEPDVTSNRQPFNGRIFLLLLDDYQTDLSRTPFVRKAAREFVEKHVSSTDLVAVVHTSGRKNGQDFTTSRTRLLAAIDSFSGTKLRSKTAAMSEDEDMTRNVMKTASNVIPQDPYATERMIHAKASAEVIQRMSEYLSGIRGRRKALVYFGEGIDHELIDVVQIDAPTVQRDTAGVREAMRNAVAAATRANVSVYMIDPRGLSTGMEGAIAMATQANPNSPTSPMRLQEEMARSHLWMRSVAEETAGIPFLNTNDVAVPLARIVDDSSSHYILGYYAPAGRKDGRFRRVEVRVTRPGLQVRARKGYYAPGGAARAGARSDLKTSPELLEAMKSPLPVDTLTFAAAAAPFKGIGSNASVAVVVEIDPGRLAFSQRGASRDTDLELQISATDPQASTHRHASHHLAELRLGAPTHESVIREGVRITRRIELRPGRYRLHLGVRDRTSGAVGTVLTDLDVPDFQAPPLAISGIVLVSAAATRMPTVESDRALAALLPGDQTARRVFPVNDTLAVFAEIYDNDLRQPHTVHVTSSVRSEDGAEVFSAAAAHESSELARAAGGITQAGGFGHRVTLPAARLGPGRYILRIQARRSTDDAVVSREVPFRIE
jgi:VWFA-related protein